MPGRPISVVQRNAARLHLLAALGIVVAIVAQVYLIGAYIFGAGAEALDAHKSIGWTTHGIEVLVLVLALVAGLGRADLLLSFLLAAIGTVQIALASAERWIGGLHPLLALAVLGLAVTLARRGARRHGLTRPAPEPARQ